MDLVRSPMETANESSLSHEPLQLHRIYVADQNREQIGKILTRPLDEFTIIEARGSWHHQPENSLVIEIATADSGSVRKAATDIKAANGEEAVLVTHFPIDMEML